MAPERPPYARREVALVLAVQGLVLLAMAPYYGPHRDELYFASAGQRLAWGYPDQPSFTPFLARLSAEVDRHSLVVLRLPAILGVLALVALAARFAQLLGARRGGQVLTAVVVAASALTMAIGHRLSTATFDTLAWTAVLVLVTQAVLDDRPRLWIAAGAVAGVGLENKHGVAFLVVGILLACALDPVARPMLRTRWPWLGGLLALVLWLPNLVWQAQNGWPVFALSADIADEYGGVGGRIGLVGQAAVMFSPFIFVIWLIGLVQLLRRPDWRGARVPALTFLATLAIFLVTTGKGYYLAGAIVPLIAAGCTWLADRKPGTRRLVGWGTALAFTGAVAWPVLVPMVPEHSYAISGLAVDYDQKETVGWPDYVAQVRAVIAALPSGQQRTAVVFTQNYGEAGAFEWYGVGLPVYSGHNGWRNWGPPPDAAGPVVVVGYDDPSRDFTGCRHAATLHNRYDLDNDEEGAEVWVCGAPTGGWPAAWLRLEHYDA